MSHVIENVITLRRNPTYMRDNAEFLFQLNTLCIKVS